MTLTKEETYWIEALKKAKEIIEAEGFLCTEVMYWPVEDEVGELTGQELLSFGVNWLNGRHQFVKQGNEPPPNVACELWGRQTAIAHLALHFHNEGQPEKGKEFVEKYGTPPQSA